MIRISAACLTLLVSGAATQAQITAAAPDLTPIPSRVLQGTVTVRNVGSANAGAFVITVQCQKQGGGSCAEHPGMNKYTNPAYPNRLVIKVPALEKGKVYNHNLTFWQEMNWQPGNYNFVIEADAGKTVGETNEGNNIGGAVLNK